MPWLRGQTGFRENDEKFWLTWIVLLVLRLPGTIRTFTFLSKSTNREIDQYLLYLQSFGDVGQALINCIIYCMFDSDVSDYVKEGFLRYKNKLWHGDAHVYIFTSLRRSASSDHLLAKASSDHLLAK
ncbi:hypothetical protein FSP39_019482 [Pinctada imbricata]|uniref:Uncharacterized protein n=1 Tax=Pinctada imbricata TaxID=66713 RepID=A0AA89C2E7_PINIB|nr:hypothetical protein FSP39_019482 [Pinctada imbricata]